MSISTFPSDFIERGMEIDGCIVNEPRTCGKKKRGKTITTILCCAVEAANKMQYIMVSLGSTDEKNIAPVRRCKMAQTKYKRENMLNATSICVCNRSHSTTIGKITKNQKCIVSLIVIYAFFTLHLW